MPDNDHNGGLAAWGRDFNARTGLRQDLAGVETGTYRDRETTRSSAITRKSSGPNSNGISAIFSTPIPCSPVGLPAHPQTGFEDIASGFDGSAGLVGIAFVIKNDWIECCRRRRGKTLPIRRR